MKVQIKKFNEKAITPTQASELAGGWDVVVTEINKISNNFVICKLGFGLTPPKGHKITLVPRSSFTNFNWVVNNSPGLGDEDYLGEYQFRFRALPTGIKVDERAFKGWGKQLFSKINNALSLTYDEFPYKVGDSIGQLYLEEVIPIEFKGVDELKPTKRGEGGFGSTDKSKPKRTPRKIKSKDV